MKNRRVPNSVDSLVSVVFPRSSGVDVSFLARHSRINQSINQQSQTDFCRRRSCLPKWHCYGLDSKDILNRTKQIGSNERPLDPNRGNTAFVCCFYDPRCQRFSPSMAGRMNLNQTNLHGWRSTKISFPRFSIPKIHGTDPKRIVLLVYRDSSICPLRATSTNRSGRVSMQEFRHC